MDVDYFKVMGLPDFASTSEIKARYKLLAKQHHPDLSGDTKTMSQINQAYAVLSNPKSRFEYTQSLAKYSSTKNSQFTKPKTNTTYYYQQQVTPKDNTRDKSKNNKQRSGFGILFSPIGLVFMLLLMLGIGGMLQQSGAVQLNSTPNSSSGNSGSSSQVASNNSPTSGSGNQSAAQSPPVSVNTNSSPSTSPTTNNSSVQSSVTSCSTNQNASYNRELRLEDKIAAAEHQLVGESDPYFYGNQQTGATYNATNYSQIQQRLSQYQTELSNYQADASNC